MEPEKEKQMADRHAVASGEDERQHFENRMRDIQIGKRGSEAASEEEPDKLRKTVLFEKLRVHQRLPIHLLLWNFLRGVRHKICGGPYLCRRQMTYKFLRWVCSTRWMDEGVGTSEKCWSGIIEKMPEISREMNSMSKLRT